MAAPRRISEEQLRANPYVIWNEFIHLLSMSRSSDLTEIQRVAQGKCVMQCPQCGSEMRPGMANAETWIGGFGLLDLFTRRPGIYFCPDDHDEDNVYVGGSRPAFCCPKCQTVVIPDRRGRRG